MLDNYIKDRLSKLEGKIGVYYKNLSTGEEIFSSRSEKFEAASVIKFTIMIEALNQIEHGKLSYDTKVILKDEYKVPSCGALNYVHEGLEFTIQDLYTLMIIISDNTATNMLINILGMDNINKTLEDLGAVKTKLNRLLFDSDASKKGIENYIAVEEMGMLLEKLYKDELISKEASKEMKRVMLEQQINHKIPFYISDVPIAHKTGEDDGITNDIGIVFAEKPFILCFAANEVNVPETERAYQDIAREAYEYTMK